MTDSLRTALTDILDAEEASYGMLTGDGLLIRAGVLGLIGRIRAALASDAGSVGAPPTYTEVERLDRPGNRANAERQGES